MWELEKTFSWWKLWAQREGWKAMQKMMKMEKWVGWL